MIHQFEVTAELQQFLAGLESKALTNVIWNATFTSSSPLLPASPTAKRRSLVFDKIGYTADATPVLEYNVYISNVDGSTKLIVTQSRGT